MTAAKERAALQQILDSKVKVMVTEIIREVREGDAATSQRNAVQVWLQVAITQRYVPAHLHCHASSARALVYFPSCPLQRWHSSHTPPSSIAFTCTSTVSTATLVKGAPTSCPPTAHRLSATEQGHLPSTHRRLHPWHAIRTSYSLPNAEGSVQVLLAGCKLL